VCATNNAVIEKKCKKRNTHKFEFLECWEISKHSVYCSFPSSISWRQIGSPAHIKSLSGRFWYGQHLAPSSVELCVSYRQQKHTQNAISFGIYEHHIQHSDIQTMVQYNQ